MSLGSERVTVVVALVVLLIEGGGINVNGQTICNVSVAGLMACRPAVSPPNPTPPSQDCCNVLSHADLRCLCSYKNSTLLPSLGIDPNLAMQLPAKCNVPHPPHC
ncbi:putative lipid-transfer protein DIR1 [Spatholobus suberectus]|nr:putative lipid-transfer protein DIR1 [Spatholobus suberectus]